MMTFGLHRKDAIRTVWKRDPAVKRILDEAAYDETLDVRHLDIDYSAAPQWWTLRPLTNAERSKILDAATIAGRRLGGHTALDLYFAAGVDMEPCGDVVTKDQIKTTDGSFIPKRLPAFDGMSMLNDVLLGVIKGWPDGDDLFAMFATWVRKGSEASSADFSPSSPGSTADPKAASGSPPTAAPSATTAPSSSAASGTAPTSA